MVNETPPPPPLPPLPPSEVQPVTIPYAIVEKWAALRYDQYLNLKVARADLDNFYTAFDKSLDAQYALQECLVRYTNGDTGMADFEMKKARRSLQESQNAFRLFFTAIMASVSDGK